MLRRNIGMTKNHKGFSKVEIGNVLIVVVIFQMKILERIIW